MKTKKKINWEKVTKKFARAIVISHNDRYYNIYSVGERTEMLARKISKMN